jgi:hypothetical protein
MIAIFTLPSVRLVAVLFRLRENARHFVGGRLILNKPMGLLRAAALNLYIPAASVHPMQRIALPRAFSPCVLPPASPKDERQNVVTPSKNWFFDGTFLF